MQGYLLIATPHKFSWSGTENLRLLLGMLVSLFMPVTVKNNLWFFVLWGGNYPLFTLLLRMINLSLDGELFLWDKQYYMFLLCFSGPLRWHTPLRWHNPWHALNVLVFSLEQWKKKGTFLKETFHRGIQSDVKFLCEHWRFRLM